MKMKSKLFIMAALCAIAFKTNAQTEKGNFLLGGAVNFSTSKNESQSPEKKTAFGVLPRMGYFVSDNWAVGTSLSYSIAKSKGYITASAGEINFGSQQSNYGISPFVRYYTRIADNFKFFGDFNVSASRGIRKNVDEHGKAGNTTSKSTTYGTAISPGLAFFPAKKWAIEFQFPLVGYVHQKDTPEIAGQIPYKYDSLSFGFSSFSPAIGVNYHF
ncbi:hypothetical protein D3C87_214070 [compost metagenome]